MSGRRPGRAVEAFIASLQRAASCVTSAVLIREPRLPGRHPALRFGDDVAPLRGVHPLALRVLVEYAAEEGEPVRWTVRTAGYRYEFQHADGPTLLAYHWHPVGISPITTPHLHLAGTLGGIDLSKAHLPTGLVTLQDVLRFAIADLGVLPLRNDWSAVLEESGSVAP